MPNHPSALAMSNRVDLYRFDVTLSGSIDADGTIVSSASYPSTPDVASIACSVQSQSVARDDGMGRASTEEEFLVIFGTDQALKLNDKLVWTDGANTELYVNGSIDGAGRHAVYEVPCTRRI